MEITLEKIELVKDRTGVSYKEAKEALEKTDGSVVDAIIDIEESVNSEDNDVNSLSGKDLIKAAKETLKKSSMARIVVKKDGEILLNLPLTVSVLGAVIAPWAVIVGTVAAAGTNCQIEFVNDKGQTTDVNGKIKSGYDAAKAKGEEARGRSRDVIDKIRESDVYNNVRAKGTDAYNRLRDNDTYNDLKDKGTEAFNAVREKGSDIASDIRNRGAGETAGEIKDKAGDTVSDLKDKAGDTVSDIKDKAGDTIVDIKNKAGDRFADLKDHQNLMEIREKGRDLFKKHPAEEAETEPENAETQDHQDQNDKSGTTETAEPSPAAEAADDEIKVQTESDEDVEKGAEELKDNLDSVLDEIARENGISTDDDDTLME